MAHNHSAAEMVQAIDELIAVGVLAKWWCPSCQDWVPYRCLEMSEAESRRKHGARHGD